MMPTHTYPRYAINAGIRLWKLNSRTTSYVVGQRASTVVRSALDNNLDFPHNEVKLLWFSIPSDPIMAKGSLSRQWSRQLGEYPRSLRRERSGINQVSSAPKPLSSIGCDPCRTATSKTFSATTLSFRSKSPDKVFLAASSSAKN